MNEKQLREAIIERIKSSNARELSAIWHFVRAFVDPVGREEAGSK